MLKICSKCKIVKDVKKFSKSKKEKDGYQYHCKKCQKEYHEQNKEKYKLYLKIYRAKRRSKKNMTLKERLFEIITEKKSVSLKDLLEKFNDRKKELFTSFQELTSDRKIGFSETAMEGLRYFIKK